MPGITITQYTPNDTTVNAMADKERVERQKYIALRWRYYDGDHDKPLKYRPGDKDPNILLNLCGRAVDKSVEFVGLPKCFELEGQDVKQDMADTEDDNPMEQALELLYKETQCEIPEVILSGLIAGHSFVKLYFDADDLAAMTLLDPQYVTIFWDAMNVKQLLFYRLQWKQGDTAYMQDIVPSWLIEPSHDQTLTVKPVANFWMIYDYKQSQGRSTWEKLREQKHEFAFAPLVEWAYKRRPHTYYGTSFLHNAINLNNGVNFVASNTGRIIEHHGHPKTFVFGAEIEAENAVGGIWDNLPTDARVETLELQSDLASSMRFFETLKSEFFATQRVIDLSTVQDKLGQITNFGVRMLFSDMLEMTNGLRTAVGGGFSEVYRRLMLMDGHNIIGKIEAEWSDQLPKNRLEVLQAATLEKNLGTTSQETLTESIDRDPSKEALLKAQEGTTSSTALVDTLEKMGNRGLLN